MRMRKRRHFDERMEACGAVLIEEKENISGRWGEIFNNDNPVHLEIGCGKGRFIAEMAKRNPDINYIGMERISNVLILAAEKAVKEEIPNVRFMSADAIILPEIFEKGELKRIYLNFSDPWPKAKHEKRRLTHKNYLDVYKKVLKEGGEIFFKTDNAGLFEFSLQSFKENGFFLKNTTFDLHKNEGDNIRTEYEEKFSALGFKINRTEAILRGEQEEL